MIKPPDKPIQDQILGELKDIRSTIATKEDILNVRKDMATKHDLEDFATKDDIKGMATKADLAKFATKDDLGAFVTKDDVKDMATKQDLEGFATKDDVKDMATKQDLAPFATKQETSTITAKLAEIQDDLRTTEARLTRQMRSNHLINIKHHLDTKAHIGKVRQEHIRKRERLTDALNPPIAKKR